MYAIPVLTHESISETQPMSSIIKLNLKTCPKTEPMLRIVTIHISIRDTLGSILDFLGFTRFLQNHALFYIHCRTGFERQKSDF